LTAPAPGFHEDDALGKVYDARLVGRLMTYVRPYGGLVGSAVLLLMADGLLQLVGPLLTRRVIDVAIPARDTGMIARAAALFAVSLALAFGAQYGETIITGLLGQRVMRDLRARIFAHVQRLPITFFDRNPVGRLVTRITSDVEALNELFTAGVVAGLGDLFTLAAIGALMIWTDWRLALAAFGVIPLVIGASFLFRRAVRGSYREIRTRLARINAFLQERLTGMRIVQVFGREGAEARRFDELNRDHLESNLKSIVYYALYFPNGKTITQGGTRSGGSGGFCAYHGTLNTTSNGEIYYGVLPDNQSGGMSVGGGSAPSAFQNMTSYSSHEMVETITDPEVGLATTYSPPLAWYDSVNGEIGDICAWQTKKIGAYTVQLEWSNQANACV